MIHDKIKNIILSYFIDNRIKNINKVQQNPFSYQKKVLKKLLSKSLNTEFGVEHKFDEINDYHSFKKNIPLRTYEEFFEYIKKCKSGAKNILWPGKIRCFAKSSGTTNSNSKYIPVTQDSLNKCHYKVGKDMLCLYSHNYPNKKKLYNGYGLMLGGSLSKGNRSYLEGDLSAILLENFPFWVKYHRLPDYNTAIMNNWKEKIERISNQVIDKNITNLTGVPSWMLILLQTILKKSGKKNILEVWPNLELYMHGGVNFDPYKEAFNQLIPSKAMNYLEGYNASEGFFAIQDQFDSKELLLMLDCGIFYEFISLSNYNNGKKDAICLKDVKLNVDYVIIISTNAGLWRYIIGDVIKFKSIKPFKIVITGRTKSYINTFGEEIIVDNTDKAIVYACKQNSCRIKDYTVAPIYLSEKSGSHQWLIEFEIYPKCLNSFKKDLDKKLKDLNSDYKAKRENDLILKEIEITCIENEFYIWMKKNNRLGGQSKIPRLSNDRKIINEILKT